MKKVLAHGTFDIIHYGHIKYLEKAKSYGDYLIVLVSSDNFSEQKKGRKPFFDEKTRCKVVSSLKCVDKVIIRDTDFSEKLINDLNIDVLVTIYSDNIRFKNICDVKIVKETKEISSTKIKDYLSKKAL